MKEIGLEERKQLQLEILKEVDTFCRTHNLTYYLAFGTLLGAIRHKGYIPWDDDVDIMMPRSDYAQLERLFPVDGNYRFLTSDNTKSFPYAFGKIVDVRTVKSESIRKRYQMIGLDIDVFPIDNYPNDIKEAQNWSDEIKANQRVLWDLFSIYRFESSFFLTIKYNVKVFLNHMLDDFGITTVSKQVAKIVELNKKYNIIDTDFQGISAIATYGVRKRSRKNAYASVIDVEFEGHQFMAPIGYDEILRDIYGDYMQLPPIEKRITHHSNKAFWK